MVADVGDVPINVFDIKANVDIIHRHVASVVANGCRPLILGGDHFITYPILRAIKVCQSYLAITSNNPPINFSAPSLDKTHHVEQNRMTGITQYTPFDLLSVARFFKQVQNKRRNLLLFNQNTLLKKLKQSTWSYFNCSNAVIITLGLFSYLPATREDNAKRANPLAP